MLTAISPMHSYASISSKTKIPNIQQPVAQTPDSFQQHDQPQVMFGGGIPKRARGPLAAIAALVLAGGLGLGLRNNHDKPDNNTGTVSSAPATPNQGLGSVPKGADEPDPTSSSSGATSTAVSTPTGTPATPQAPTETPKKDSSSAIVDGQINLSHFPNQVEDVSNLKAWQRQDISGQPSDSTGAKVDSNTANLTKPSQIVSPSFSLTDRDTYITFKANFDKLTAKEIGSLSLQAVSGSNAYPEPVIQNVHGSEGRYTAGDIFDGNSHQFDIYTEGTSSGTQTYTLVIRHDGTIFMGIDGQKLVQAPYNGNTKNLFKGERWLVWNLKNNDGSDKGDGTDAISNVKVLQSKKID